MLDCFIEGGDHWPAEMFTKNQTPASSLQLLQQVTIPQRYSSDESLHCLEPRGREIIVVQEVGVNHLSITQWKVSILCLPGLILTIPTAKESLGELKILLYYFTCPHTLENLENPSIMKAIILLQQCFYASCY